jgi:hypothetical protein
LIEVGAAFNLESDCPLSRQTMEDLQEISNSNGKSVVTFTLTLPSQIHSADLVSALRQARSEKLKLGHDAAAAAIGNLLSLARPELYFPLARGAPGAAAQRAEV